MSKCLHVNKSTCQYVYMSLCLHVNMSTCHKVYMSICLHVNMFTCHYVYMTICLHVNMSELQILSRTGIAVYISTWLTFRSKVGHGLHHGHQKPTMKRLQQTNHTLNTLDDLFSTYNLLILCGKLQDNLNTKFLPC